MKILTDDQNSENKKMDYSYKNLNSEATNATGLPNKKNYIHKIRKLNKNTKFGNFTMFVKKLS